MTVEEKICALIDTYHPTAIYISTADRAEFDAVERDHKAILENGAEQPAGAFASFNGVWLFEQPHLPPGQTLFETHHNHTGMKLDAESVKNLCLGPPNPYSLRRLEEKG